MYRILIKKERIHMRCPYCGFTESKVIDSRPTEESNAIRRRRECLKCQKRFTTYEKLEAISLVVIKKISQDSNMTAIRY